MKAMIFAAGRGTRLKPLTDNIPKALVKVGNKTLLEHVILKLKGAGVTDIIVNTHYLAPQITLFLRKKNFGLNISISNEQHLLLETGGGLVNAAHFFDKNEDFFVHNVDILSDIDLNAMWHYHKEQKSLATLAVKSRKTSRYFLFDTKMQLCGWKNTNTNEEIVVKTSQENLKPLAFSGIHIINSKIFEHITETGVFSLTPVYIRLAKEHKIRGFRHDYSQWFDIGRIETLKAAEDYFRL